MVNKERELLKAVLDADESIQKVQAEIDRFNPALKEAERKKMAAEIELMNFMDDTGKEQFKNTDFNVVVTKNNKFKASLNVENKEEALDFIQEECGREDAVKIKRDVHWQTLTSILNDRIKEALPVPRNLFNLNYWNTLSVKKMKK